MVSKDSLLKVKQDVESYVGQEILIKANIGRNKCICRKGVIDSTYSNLFVFKESDTTSRLSYSYADLNGLIFVKHIRLRWVVNIMFAK